MATLRRVVFSLLFLLSAGARPSVAQAITPPGGATNAGGQVIVTTNYLYYNKMHFAGTWSSSGVYNSQDVVIYSGLSYASLQIANSNNQPDTHPLWWTPVTANAVSTLGSYSDPSWLTALGAAKLTGTLLAAQEPAHTGDMTNTAGSLGTTVKGLNGVALSGLPTGILKNTSSTGTPTIALAGTDYDAGIYQVAAQLPKFRTALAATRNGDSDTIVDFYGDSTTHGLGSGGTSVTIGSYPTRVAQLLASSKIPAANGLATSGSNASVDDFRWTMGTGWNWGSGGFAASGFGAITPSGTLVFTPGSTQGTYDSFSIFYGIGDGGSFTATATGGSGSTFNGAGACCSVGKMTITAASAGTGNAVTISSVTGQVKILAIEPFLSTTKTVRIGNVGVESSTSTNWNDVGIWGGVGTVASIKAHAPHLCAINLGINDAGASISPSTYATNLTALVTACRISGDVVFMTMFPSSGAPWTTNEPALVSQIYSLASSLGIPVIDIWTRFSGTFQTNLMTNTLHPNTYGYYDAAEAVTQFLTAVIGPK